MSICNGFPTLLATVANSAEDDGVYFCEIGKTLSVVVQGQYLCMLVFYTPIPCIIKFCLVALGLSTLPHMDSPSLACRRFAFFLVPDYNAICELPMHKKLVSAMCTGREATSAARRQGLP